MTEIYDLSIDGLVIITGTFKEVTDELCKMHMHGCHFQDVGDAITITRRE